jgi:hypothetical protein
MVRSRSGFLDKASGLGFQQTVIEILGRVGHILASPALTTEALCGKFPPIQVTQRGFHDRQSSNVDIAQLSLGLVLSSGSRRSLKIKRYRFSIQSLAFWILLFVLRSSASRKYSSAAIMRMEYSILDPKPNIRPVVAALLFPIEELPAPRIPLKTNSQSPGPSFQMKAMPLVSRDHKAFYHLAIMIS